MKLSQEVFIKCILWINVEDEPVKCITCILLLAFSPTNLSIYYFIDSICLNKCHNVFLLIDDVSPYRTQRNLHHEGKSSILQGILENDIATKEIRRIDDIGASL